MFTVKPKNKTKQKTRKDNVLANLKSISVSDYLPYMIPLPEKNFSRALHYVELTNIFAKLSYNLGVYVINQQTSLLNAYYQIPEDSTHTEYWISLKNNLRAFYVWTVSLLALKSMFDDQHLSYHLANVCLSFKNIWPDHMYPIIHLPNGEYVKEPSAFINAIKFFLSMNPEIKKPTTKNTVQKNKSMTSFTHFEIQHFTIDNLNKTNNFTNFDEQGLQCVQTRIGVIPTDQMSHRFHMAFIKVYLTAVEHFKCASTALSPLLLVIKNQFPLYIEQDKLTYLSKNNEVVLNGSVYAKAQHYLYRKCYYGFTIPMQPVFDKVSYEVILYIFSFLGIKDIATMYEVGKRFNAIANDTVLWKRFYQRYIGEVGQKESRPKAYGHIQQDNETYKQIFFHKARYIKAIGLRHFTTQPRIDKGFLNLAIRIGASVIVKKILAKNRSAAIDAIDQTRRDVPWGIPKHDSVLYTEPVSIRQDKGTMPLHWAVWLQHLPTIKYLLACIKKARSYHRFFPHSDNGFDKRTSICFVTPLSLSIKTKNIQVVQLLLANKVWPTLAYRDVDEKNYLHITAETGCEELIKLIFWMMQKLFTDENIQQLFSQTDRHGNTPLHYVARYNLNLFVKLVKSRFCSEMYDKVLNEKQMLSPLKLAMLTFGEDLVETMLNTGSISACPVKLSR